METKNLNQTAFELKYSLLNIVNSREEFEALQSEFPFLIIQEDIDRYFPVSDFIKLNSLKGGKKLWKTK